MSREVEPEPVSSYFKPFEARPEPSAQAEIHELEIQRLLTESVNQSDDEMSIKRVRRH